MCSNDENMKKKENEKKKKLFIAVFFHDTKLLDVHSNLTWCVISRFQ